MNGSGRPRPMMTRRLGSGRDRETIRRFDDSTTRRDVNVYFYPARARARPCRRLRPLVGRQKKRLNVARRAIAYSRATIAGPSDASRARASSDG